MEYSMRYFLRKEYKRSTGRHLINIVNLRCHKTLANCLSLTAKDNNDNGGAIKLYTYILYPLSVYTYKLYTYTTTIIYS